MEQELPTLPEHMSSRPVFSVVPVPRSLDLCVCFVDRCLSFCPFVLAIVFSVLLRFTDSDYPFGIFKLYLSKDGMLFYTKCSMVYGTLCMSWQSLSLTDT